MATAVIDRLVLVAYGSEPPTDPEWLDYVRLMERQGVGETVHLIYTEGGEPTASQRHQLVALLAGRTVPVAIVSDSARVRGSTILLSWFVPQIKAFPPSQLADAIAHLEIPVSRADLIGRELRRLRMELVERRLEPPRPRGAA